MLNLSKESNPLLNQSLVNWYEHDGSIGKHSDNMTQLIENSDIYSYTFGPAKRDFRLESISNNGNDYILICNNVCGTNGHLVQKFRLMVM